MGFYHVLPKHPPRKKISKGQPTIKHKGKKPPCRDPLVPADPVFVQLFADLKLARDVDGLIKRRAAARPLPHKRFEREAFAYLMTYMLTLDCEIRPQ